jgi:hypothetical protein
LNSNTLFSEKQKDLSDSEYEDDGEEIGIASSDEEGEEVTEEEEGEDGEDEEDDEGSYSGIHLDYELPDKKGSKPTKVSANNISRSSRTAVSPRGIKAVRSTPAVAEKKMAVKRGKPSPPAATAAKAKKATGSAAKKVGGAKKEKEKDEDGDGEWKRKLITEDTVVHDFSGPKKKLIRDKFNLGKYYTFS